MKKYFSDMIYTCVSFVKGFKVTLVYFFKKPTTVIYPYERITVAERFRGIVQNDVSRCTSCMICAGVCPVSCISIKSRGKKEDRTPAKYDIDLNKCMWCGYCAEACPTKSLTMSKDYEHSVYDRKELLLRFVPEENPAEAAVKTNDAA